MGKKRLDPVTVEVIRNYCVSTAREMRNVIYRHQYCHYSFFHISSFSCRFFVLCSSKILEHYSGLFLRLCRLS